MDKYIYSGTLYLLPIGWKQVLKKTWQEKYCLVYKASKSGIERLEIFDNPDHDSTPRIITLENCIKIEQKSATVFSVITKSNIHDFMATNEDSLQQWIFTLQQVAFKDFNNKVEIANICEDNELYCPSVDGPIEFTVTLHSTEASNRCKLEGKANYVLVSTSNAIQLFKRGATSTKENRILLFTWPYCYVRRYGHKDGKFTFEAGRKCESGEGMFLFDHDNQQEIFRCVSSKMKNMKKMLNESGNNKGTTMSASSESIEQINCGENQLHAALTMEAGSRSPLPPSPTTSTTLQDIDSINLNSTSMSISTITKDIPKKPPRKNILINNDDEKNSRVNYETIERYDEVERRENAWKTLGTVDVRHSDRVIDCSTDSTIESTKSDIESILQTKSIRKPAIQKSINPKAAAKVIYSPELSTDDNIYNTYDHLSFFGSTSKLCSTPSNGYKHVTPAQSNNNQTSSKEPVTIDSNDYDEVGVSTVNIGMNTIGVSQLGDVVLEGVRSADDSHLGYAVVRKGIAANVLEHRMYNENPYAVISKPKRV